MGGRSAEQLGGGIICQGMSLKGKTGGGPERVSGGVQEKCTTAPLSGFTYTQLINVNLIKGRLDAIVYTVIYISLSD